MNDLMLPPHSVEAEQAVLGGLMLDNSRFDDVIDRVGEHDFYRREHRLIFNAIHRLSLKMQPFDALTISEELGDDLQAAGDLAYLAELSSDTPSAANVPAYADIVRGRALLRELIQRGNDIVSAALKGGNAGELVDRAQVSLAELSAMTPAGMQRLESVIQPWIEELDAHQQSGGGMLGVPSGFVDLDARLSGLCSGDLIVVAGRPSMGKSAFAFQIAGNLALSGEAVAVFSLEMPVKQVFGRLVSQVGKIDHTKIRNATLDEQEWAQVSQTIAKLKAAKLYIDDSSGLQVNEIRSRTRKLNRQDKLKLIVVDYLQLMATVKGERHDLDIGEITRSLKGLAKELDCAVVLLSQLNRAVEQRGDKRPRMSDLRESGSIEQDADVIIFPFRQEVYDQDDPSVKGIAEIITAKHRNGPIGTDMMAWLENYQRFEPLDEHSTRRYRAKKRQSRGFEAA